MTSGRVYVATVGSSKEPVLKGLLYARPDYVYLLHGQNPTLKERDPERVAQEVRHITESMGTSACVLRAVDSFSFDEITSAIIDIWKDHTNDTIVANMTGGTNVMAAACLLAGFSISATVIYVKEPPAESETPLDKQVLVLPTPKIPLSHLSKPLRETLSTIRNNTDPKGGTVLWAATTYLADELHKSPQTISYLLKKLQGLGLVEIQREGRKNGVSLTSSGTFVARFFSS